MLFRSERHPNLKITIDHLALGRGKDEVAFKEFDLLLPLAKRPNISVKVSCLPLYTTDVYPFKWLHPYVRRIYDAFGPKRFLTSFHSIFAVPDIVRAIPGRRRR